jgi:hypothetical protein
MNFEFNYSRRDELSDIISDSYKDLYGVRPRFIDFANTSLDELERLADDISSKLRVEIEREKKEKQEIIKKILEYGAPDAKTAQKWLDDAEYNF